RRPLLCKHRIETACAPDSQPHQTHGDDDVGIPSDLCGPNINMPQIEHDPSPTSQRVTLKFACSAPAAVFDFGLIDASLEGAIRGARADEQERLARLSDQLRQLLRDSGRASLVDRTRGAGKQPASLRWLRYALGAASTRNKDRIWKRPITPSPSLRRFAGV